MTSPRVAHAATLLPSGKVLIAGGLDDTYASLGSSELYDPVAGAWTPTGNMPTAVNFHTATLLQSGNVLITGGNGAFAGPPLASARLYDPVTGTWRLTGTMASSRVGHTATLLPSGKVLAAGGSDATLTPLASAELYDPISGVWALTGSMTTARFLHTAATLPDGNVLAIGGRAVYTGGPLASAELYTFMVPVLPGCDTNDNGNATDNCRQ
jgi:hypothetical protein